VLGFAFSRSYRFSNKYDICSISPAIVNHSSREAMPIAYQINRSKNLTVFTWAGQVMFSELTDSLRAYAKDGPTRYELYDLRELTGERLSKEEIERLVAFLNKHASYRPKNSETAVVVDQDIDFGISTMIATLTYIDGVVPYEVKVFRSMGEAINWLDLEADTNDPNQVT
jgi:hypothetical protein